MPYPRILQRLFANEGAGPKLRGDIIPYGSTADTAAQGNDARLVSLEAWRQAMIGTPMPMAGTTLPSGFMWADGSFASFASYPELKAKYDAGGFAGILLAYNASEQDIAAYPGKFKPDAANPTGLFVPRLNGLFARYCGGQGEAGVYQADAIQTGITGIMAEPMGGATQYWNCAHPFGNLTASAGYSDSAILYIAEVGAQIPHYTFTVNQRVADKTRPENVALPAALYMGKPAEV